MLLIPINAKSATYVVDKLGNGDFITIQSAISSTSPNVVSGDTLTVRDGTYTEAINFQGKNLTIKSVNGAANTIINATSLNSPVVTFATWETSAAVLDGFTLMGGSGLAGNGGGIYISGASPTINNCLITGNIANSGVGVYVADNMGGGLTMSGCWIKANYGTSTANAYGGGIYATFSGYGVTISLTNCVIANNTVLGTADAYGAGIHANNANMTLMNCTVAYNSWSAPAGGGGGLYWTGAGTLDVTNTLFFANTAGAGGELNLPPSVGPTSSIFYSNTNPANNVGSWTSQGNNINVVDPNFTNFELMNYSLLSSSGCIDMGTLTGAPATDIWGKTRDALPDIGAHEYVAPGSDDHGDTAAAATALTVDVATATTGDIELVTDEDWFSFTAEAGKMYNIEMILNTILSAYVELYAADGTTNIYYKLITGAAGTKGSIAWTCDTAGTYYVLAKSVGNTTGTYTVSAATLTPTITPVASDGAATLTWSANSVEDHTGYKIYFGTAPGVYDAPGSPLDVGNVLTYPITGLANNTTYFFKVTYYKTNHISSAVTEHEYGKEIYTTPFPPTTTTTVSYSGGPGNYSMIAFPVNLADKNPVTNLGPIFNPGVDQLTYDGEVWRLYAHDLTVYHQPSDNCSCTDLTFGRGYWVVSLNDTSITLTGPTVNSSNDFPVELVPGWNLIGNPFNFAVNVSDLKVGDGATDVSVAGGTLTTPVLYYYENGAYVAVTQMLANRGYWIKNRSATAITLKIPPIVATAAVTSEVKSLIDTDDDLPPAPPSATQEEDDSKSMCFVATAAYEENAADSLNYSGNLLDFIVNIYTLNK
ncbi:choice-of-anchor Q domain-containing protein [Thermodesulfobacteriota bacterium]